MAPNIAQIDADRQLGLGTPAGYFCDEVLRWLLHGKQSLSDPEDLLIPFLVVNGNPADLNTLIGGDSSLYLLLAFSVNAGGEIADSGVNQSTGDSRLPGNAV
jgi:hypothetical protein